MSGNKQLTLNDIVEKAVMSLGLDFVGCDYLPQGKHSLLRIYIDNVAGVTIEDCARTSRQVSAILEVDTPIKGEYRLEVSSPGTDRPLFTLEQYRQFIGSNIKICLNEPFNNKRNFQGELVQVIDDNIVVDIDKQSMIFSFTNIQKANLVVDI